MNCPRLIHYVRPTYPKEAKRRRTEGTVKLRAVISATGGLRNIEVLQGEPILAAAALGAVRRWRYSVCLIDGTRVEPVTAINIQFTLAQ